MGIKGLSKFVQSHCKATSGAFFRGDAAIRARLDAGTGSRRVRRAVAVDANNHLIRLCKAHATTDPIILSRALRSWMRDLHDDLGFDTFYLVCDGRSGPSKLTWEAQRRAARRAATQHRLCMHKAQLDGLRATQKRVCAARAARRASKAGAAAAAAALVSAGSALVSAAVAPPMSGALFTGAAAGKKEEEEEEEDCAKDVEDEFTRAAETSNDPWDDDIDMHLAADLSASHSPGVVAARLRGRRIAKLGAQLQRRTAQDGVYLNRAQVVEIARLAAGAGGAGGGRFARLGLSAVVWEGTEGVEAEAVCATVTRAGLAMASASEDSDTLPLGATFMLRESSHFQPERTLLDITRVRQVLGMSLETMVHACVLAGCDLTPHIPKVGPAKAFQLVSTFRTLDTALDHLSVNRAFRSVPRNFEWLPRPLPIWPYKAQSCPVCHKARKDPVRTCHWCSRLFCGREHCWSAHKPSCFERLVRGTMGDACADFLDAHHVSPALQAAVEAAEDAAEAGAGVGPGWDEATAAACGCVWRPGKRLDVGGAVMGDDEVEAECLGLDSD